MAVARTVLAVVIVLVGSLVALLLPTLQMMGVFRAVQPFGTRDCTTVAELQACEDVVLHAPTGVVYTACSTPRERRDWLRWLPQEARTQPDYFATYDPSTGTITHLRGFDGNETIALHGLDLVPSSDDPNVLFLYAVNHRRRSDGIVGPTDSVIEVFSTRVGSDVLQHKHTFRDPAVMITPNSVVGSSDGKSIYFTNSESRQVSWQDTLARSWVMIRPTTSVGYCHVDTGCVFAATKMYGNNGMTRARENNTFYVALSTAGEIAVMERQTDNSLLLVDKVHIGMIMDNLRIDQNGVVWATAFPKSNDFVECVHEYGPCHASTATFAISRQSSSGPYRVDKVLEANGDLSPAGTVSSYDAKRNRLFLSGVFTPHLTMCTL